MTTDTTITPELLDQLLANYEKPEDLTGADGLFKQLKKALIERALGAELSDHLGYEKGDPAGRGSGNSRNLAFVAWKDRKAILPAIKAIYRAENADMALVRLEEFEDEWGKRYPAIGQAWRRAWEHVVPFFAFAPGVRKMIYTTNAVEALHRSLRKIIKTRGSFPNDDAALKLLYLAIKNAGLRWRRGVEWTAAMGQFAIQFGSRFPGSAR